MSDMKYKMLITISPDIEEFGAVLNCAIRYCIGRMTYMPSLVTDWIMSHCGGMLTSKALYVMRKDIEEAKAEDRLGMEMDKQTWEKFLKWVKEEQGEN